MSDAVLFAGSSSVNPSWAVPVAVVVIVPDALSSMATVTV